MIDLNSLTTVEWGHFCLILAACVALVQGLVPLAFLKASSPAASTGTSGASSMAFTSAVSQMLRFARRAALLHWGVLALSCASLVWAFIQSDFSVALVANHSHVDKPFLYKIAGVWGNHEGSMMLWVLVLASYAASFAVFSGALPDLFRARVLAVMGLIELMFLSFIIFTSNPFARLNPAPFEGAGLNPVLQDPALAGHPPLLYMGYVGYALVFAFAVASLIEADRSSAWARWVRPWALIAWLFLTLGIALGSYWAYYELGWGGFWFWDPVENASLMPWLIGTAFLHSIMVTGRDGQFSRWTLLLAISCFAMSLIGTFLVRSGVLTSVHAFANDPARGFYILGMFTITLGSALVLYARAFGRGQAPPAFAPLSREAALLTNNIFLATATATVLIGTLYPLAIDMLGLGKISVGPPYFSAVFIPLSVPFFLLMPIGPWMRWQSTDFVTLKASIIKTLIAVILALVMTLALRGFSDPWAMAAIAGALWLVFGSVLSVVRSAGGRIQFVPSRRLAALTAHAGMGVMLLGIIGATAWKQELVVAAKPGDQLRLAGHLYAFDQVGTRNGDNFQATVATLRPVAGGQILQPERRFYKAERSQTTEAAIDVRVFSHIYAVLGEDLEDGKYVIRMWYHPLVVLIWVGGLIMALGAFLALQPWQMLRQARARGAVSGETV